MATVEIRNLVKQYPGAAKAAIPNANLTIDDQSFVVLVGPSGCGKSTLLRMIAGLEEISGGELLIDGQRMNDLSPKDRDIAMVFQNYALYPHMSVYENMAFGLKLRKFSKAEIDNRVRAAADILDMKELLDRKPKAMSGGQRQRVAIGRAIVREPKVFLFDEPLSNLDAKLRVQMRVEIKRLHQRLKATMVYVTHDQVEAMTMGDKIVVLKAGVIQQADSPMNLYNNPANLFVAGFIGSPSMNFGRGTLVAQDKTLRFVNSALDFQIPASLADTLVGQVGKEIIFGFRPESIYDICFPSGKTLTEPQRITIDVTEPIGSETFLYFSLQDQVCCMRTLSDSQYQPNQTIDVGFDTERLYFFDPQTEQRIG
ncbi:sn-glycerol-3-phosphate ABC transporter ATP-binding protein UgpC [Spirosoma sp. BT702]|uniref:Sn-glycerol-3-phosphate ABC transporter ATP-binding protein UgpC n=1 Tax=Spirosoma profusum TaxID=2771354 RepID=A0A927ATB8_9BACT|nr:sn-glycerol-3-phosphate ABC transporter ATP-binding protein UgpC [Spirosoma profusum]MBD2703110.1 sn-glycerol-3-phosphate ABC transporter ATP-binding protein UgpC [Spirosoma profusum]